MSRQIFSDKKIWGKGVQILRINTILYRVVWEGLRFVIVALPGLFSYLFYIDIGEYCLELGYQRTLELIAINIDLSFRFLFCIFFLLLLCLM